MNEETTNGPGKNILTYSQDVKVAKKYAIKACMLKCSMQYAKK
jgi:hypothetical protein